jgi:ParB family chromosome partitioning protein
MKNKQNNKKQEVKKQKSAEVIRYENVLADKYNTKVSINHNSNYKGKIEIEYYNLDDLNRIIEQL